MKKLYRSEEDKKIAGICGGLGEYFAIDPTIRRLAFVFVGLATGVLPIVVAYIILTRERIRQIEARALAKLKRLPQAARLQTLGRATL